MKNNEPQPIQEEYQEVKQGRPYPKHDITFIGMPCRFPGVKNYENFSENIDQQINFLEGEGIVGQKRNEYADKPKVTWLVDKIKTKVVRIYDKTPHSFILQHTQRPSLESKIDSGSMGVTGQVNEEHVREIIAEKLSESLKVDIGSIDTDEVFENYGIDALTEVYLVQDINRALLIDLKTTSIFDHNSINQLTAYILSEFGDKNAGVLGKSNKHQFADDDSIMQGQHKYCALPEVNAQGGIDEIEQEVESCIKKIMVETLPQSLKIDISSISSDISFTDYGVEAIAGIDLVQAINKALSIELETTSIFDYSSVSQLTKYILSKFKSVIVKALGQTKLYGYRTLSHAVGI